MSVTCPCSGSEANSSDNENDDYQHVQSICSGPGIGLCSLHVEYRSLNPQVISTRWHFYPHFTGKKSESHKGLEICSGSHREPVAKPGSKPREFASKIYVLHSYFLPACLSKLGIEASLSPNFTSLLIALYKY